MEGSSRSSWKNPETRARRIAGMIIASKRRWKDPEARVRHGAILKGKLAGDKHPAWLGGISRDPYGWEWNDELREEVRRRDGYGCQKCGVPQAECKRKLSVHHIDYDKKNNDPVNLLALCLSCHLKTNKNREHWTAFFREMMLKRAIASLGAGGRAQGAQ